jgi:hypothetical protein
MNVRPFALALLLSVVPGGALMAQQQGSDPAVAGTAVGPETRAWVDLQTSGGAASPVARPMPGDIAERVYQRHADSFAHPIPETLRQDSFSSGGSSSSGGK